MVCEQLKICKCIRHHLSIYCNLANFKIHKNLTHLIFISPENGKIQMGVW